jgi:hypothetical protein
VPTNLAKLPRLPLGGYTRGDILASEQARKINPGDHVRPAVSAPIIESAGRRCRSRFRPDDCPLISQRVTVNLCLSLSILSPEDRSDCCYRPSEATATSTLPTSWS